MKTQIASATRIMDAPVEEVYRIIVVWLFVQSLCEFSRPKTQPFRV